MNPYNIPFYYGECIVCDQCIDPEDGLHDINYLDDEMLTYYIREHFDDYGCICNPCIREIYDLIKKERQRETSDGPTTAQHPAGDS